MAAVIQQPELAARVDANLRAVTTAWTLACSTGATWEDDGLFVASCGVSMRSFNVAFVTRVDLERLNRACALLRGRTDRYRVRVRGDVAVDHAAIDAAQLQQQGGVPSLLLSPVRVGRRADPLEIRPVRDAESLRHHVEVVAASFSDWRPEVLGLVFTERLVAHPAWRGYVGYADGLPVASSQLFVEDGVAGIYYVSTLEPYRRRGFGEAMTAHAALEGVASGCEMASLQASPLGLPIYERMGFRQIDYYRTYIPKEA